MLSRVITSWIEEFGTSVVAKALDMTVEIALNDSVDSLPPVTTSVKLSFVLDLTCLAV